MELLNKRMIFNEDSAPTPPPFKKNELKTIDLCFLYALIPFSLTVNEPVENNRTISNICYIPLNFTQQLRFLFSTVLGQVSFYFDKTN